MSVCSISHAELCRSLKILCTTQLKRVHPLLVFFSMDLVLQIDFTSIILFHGSSLIETLKFWELKTVEQIDLWQPDSYTMLVLWPFLSAKNRAQHTYLVHIVSEKWANRWQMAADALHLMRHFQTQSASWMSPVAGINSRLFCLPACILSIWLTFSRSNFTSVQVKPTPDYHRMTYHAI